MLKGCGCLGAEKSSKRGEQSDKRWRVDVDQRVHAPVGLCSLSTSWRRSRTREGPCRALQLPSTGNRLLCTLEISSSMRSPLSDASRRANCSSRAADARRTDCAAAPCTGTARCSGALRNFTAALPGGSYRACRSQSREPRFRLRLSRGMDPTGRRYGRYSDSTRCHMASPKWSSGTRVPATELCSGAASWSRLSSQSERFVAPRYGLSSPDMKPPSCRCGELGESARESRAIGVYRLAVASREPRWTEPDCCRAGSERSLARSC